MSEKPIKRAQARCSHIHRRDTFRVSRACGPCGQRAPRSSDELTFKIAAFPPYASELNLIKQCWVKLKTALCQVHTCPCRTLDAALKRALQTITLADAQARSGIILSSPS